MDQYSYSPAIALTAESVAGTMMELIQENKYPRGTVLEVTLQGNVVTKTKQVWELAPVPPEVIRPAVEKSFEPVREALKAERGT